MRLSINTPSDRGRVAQRRTRKQNDRFNAMLNEWASKSGQDAASLKRRVKDHLGAHHDFELPNDPMTEQILVAFSNVLLALGKPDLMWVMPDRRCVRMYHTSSKWTKEQMRHAIDTVDLMAAEEGVVLGRADNWQEEVA
jgi:hypothetical protein